MSSCKKCRGTGYAEFKLPVSNGGSTSLYTFAAHCDCKTGLETGERFNASNKRYILPSVAEIPYLKNPYLKTGKKPEQPEAEEADDREVWLKTNLQKIGVNF